MWAALAMLLAQQSGCQLNGVDCGVLALQAATSQFVANGAFQPYLSLLANYPCGSAAAPIGRYGRVNDAFGSVSTVFVCEQDAVFGPYWRPQRTDYSVSIAQASGAVTLIPLATAPVVYLPTTPTGSVSVVLSTTNVWPGASFHVYAPATISVSGITISGLVGGGTVPLLQGSDKIITYVAGVGWKSN